MNIPIGFDVLIHHIEQHRHYADFKEMMKYMEETWVALDCNLNRPALGKFPPKFWSVHTPTLTGEDRTNNKVEGWHLKINLFMEQYHLVFYVFLEELKKFFRAEEDRRREDHRAALDRAARIATGAVVPTASDLYTRRSAELKVLCENYQNQLYVTNPQSVGYIRFLSEIAEVLTRHE